MKSGYLPLVVTILFLAACGGEGTTEDSPPPATEGDFTVGIGEGIGLNFSDKPFLTTESVEQLIVTDIQFSVPGLRRPPFENVYAVSSAGQVTPAINNIHSIDVSYTFYDSVNDQIWMSAASDLGWAEDNLMVSRVITNTSDFATIGPEFEFPYPLSLQGFESDYPSGQLLFVTVDLSSDPDDPDAFIESKTDLAGPHHCESRTDNDGNCLVEIQIFPEGVGTDKEQYNLHIGSVISTLEETYKRCRLIRFDLNDETTHCAHPLDYSKNLNSYFSVYGFFIPISIPVESWPDRDLESTFQINQSSDFGMFKPGLKPTQVTPGGSIYHSVNSGVTHAESLTDEFENFDTPPSSLFWVLNDEFILYSLSGLMDQVYNIPENETTDVFASLLASTYDNVNTLIDGDDLRQLDSPNAPVRLVHGASWDYAWPGQLSHISSSGHIYSCNSQKGITTLIPESDFSTLVDQTPSFACNDMDILSDESYVTYNIQTANNGDDIQVLEQASGSVKNIFEDIGYTVYGALRINSLSMSINESVLTFTAYNDHQSYLFNVNLDDFISDENATDYLSAVAIPGTDVVDITHLNNAPPSDTEIPSSAAPSVTEFLQIPTDRRYVGLRFNVAMDKKSVNDGITLTENGEPISFAPIWAGSTIYIVPQIYPEGSSYEEDGYPPPAGESYFKSGKTYQLQLDTSSVSSDTGMLMIEHPEPDSTHLFTFN